MTNITRKFASLVGILFMATALGCASTARHEGTGEYVDDTAKIFLRCAESEVAGARVYTLRGTVIQMQEFIAALEHDSPPARGHISAVGPALPIAFDLDNSALLRDLGDIPNTPLSQGIRETREIFERLHDEGSLGTSDLDT